MRKILVTAFAITMGLAGWTEGANAGPFSATRPVIAILGSNIHVGIAEGHLDGSGTVSIHSLADPEVKCAGEFTSSNKLGGAGELKCTDGSTATFKFQRLTVFSGHGAGNFSRGPMSFTYGLSADEAERYLKLPSGKILKRNGEDLQLADL